MSYKWCAVPKCKNTSIKTPDKLFVSVPKHAKVRKKWFQLAHRNPNDIVLSSNVFFCEDHFEMEKVISNYYQHKMGFSQKLLLVHGALPSKFQCQHDVRKKLSEAGCGAIYSSKKSIQFFQPCDQHQFLLGNLTVAHKQQGDKEMQEAVISEPIEPLQSYDEIINHPIVTADKSDQVCRICFAADCKLYHMTSFKMLSETYETLTGLLNEDNLPPYLCSECARQLLYFARFRDTSLRAHSILLEILKNHGYITLQLIQSVNETHSSLNQNDYDLDVALTQKDHISIDVQAGVRPYLVPAPGLHEDNVVERVKTDNDGVIKQEILKVETDDTVFISSSDKDINGHRDKIEKIVNQDVFIVENTINDKVYMSSLRNGIAIDSGKAEHTTNDKVCMSGLHDGIAKDDVKIENTTNDDTVYMSSSEVFIAKDGVKTENNDVINRNNLNAKDTTNNDMMLVPVLHEHVAVDGVKVEKDLINENFVNIENINNDDMEFKNEFVGEDYSSNDRILEQGIQNVDVSTTGVQEVREAPQAEVDTRREPAADGGVLVNDKLSCDVCPYRTNSELQLSSHVKAHAAAASCNYKTCSYVTMYSDNLTNHLKSHSIDKLYSSNACRRVCKSNDVKLFSCKICCKAFNFKCHLLNHVRTHSGDKPFSCDICNKAFKQKNNLTAHMTTHADVKPFPCGICNKAYNKKNNLSIHMRTHFREKPFSCDMR